MGAVRLLPGTTFSNTIERGEYDSESRAVMTLPELERWLTLQIAGVYHLTTHSALGQSPLRAWQESTKKLKQPIRLPADAQEFFLDFLPAEARLIRKDGIHFHSIRYWSSVLSPWAGRLQRPVRVAFDPRNLSRVYLRDPNGQQYWAIPYADLGQPPIALWELEAARKRLREAGYQRSNRAANLRDHPSPTAQCGWRIRRISTAQKEGTYADGAIRAAAHASAWRIVLRCQHRTTGAVSC